MKILIVVSGGREHALALAVRGASRLLMALGIAGTREFGESLGSAVVKWNSNSQLSPRDRLQLT